jgi:hypothetical protein
MWRRQESKRSHVGLETLVQDLSRFIWRGALGGMIVPALYLFALYGPAFILYFLITSFWLAIPGAIVGAFLWFLCARFVDSLGALLRITIGVVIASTVMTLMSFSTFSSHGDLADLPLLIFWLPLNGASIGVLAGWLCPSATVFRKEPKLTHWERVRQYEEAQAEHDYWKAQLESGKSRADKR